MRLRRPWRASPLCPHVAVGSGPGWLTEDQLVWGRSPEQWTPEGNLLLWAGQGPVEGTAAAGGVTLPSRLVGSSEPTSGCPCEQVWHGGVGRGSPTGAQAPSTYGVLTSCVSAPHLGPPFSPCAGWVPRSPTGPARLSLEPKLHAQRPAWTMVPSLALGWGRGSLALRAVEVWKPQSLPRGHHAGQAEAGWAPGRYPQRCVWGAQPMCALLACPPSRGSRWLIIEATVRAGASA